jgi:7-cyano-7-deazaguanine synthase
MSKAIVLLSGGLDSATVAAIAMKEDGNEVTALSFDYGQRHKKELQAARIVAGKLGIAEHEVVSINLSKWGGSSLTDSNMIVPKEGIDTGILTTYVPGRNTVFLAVALALAEAKGIDFIYLGINAVDYSGYPDCRPEYLNAYQRLANVSSKAALEGNAPDLIAPLIYATKVQIVQRAMELGVPIADTWSCYQGEEEPCGVCDSCRIRDKALEEAGYFQTAA